jgi:hypothetical protein
VHEIDGWNFRCGAKKMKAPYEPLSAELRALIVLLVLSIQIILAIKAKVALFDLFILDLTLMPLMWLQRKKCCRADKGHRRASK